MDGKLNRLCALRPHVVKAKEATFGEVSVSVYVLIHSLQISSVVHEQCFKATAVRVRLYDL